jgi:hypothetical protein
MLRAAICFSSALMESEAREGFGKVVRLCGGITAPFFGMWRARQDIHDSVEYARALRAKA